MPVWRGLKKQNKIKMFLQKKKIWALWSCGHSFYTRLDCWILTNNYDISYQGLVYISRGSTTELPLGLLADRIPANFWERPFIRVLSALSGVHYWFSVALLFYFDYKLWWFTFIIMSWFMRLTSPCGAVDIFFTSVSKIGLCWS